MREPMPGACDICQAPVADRHLYCSVCQRVFEYKPERQARIDTLKRVRRADGFYCEYSGARLNMTDRSDPFHIHLDHRVPGVLNDLAATGAIINWSKANLTYLEFPLVVHETVHHWDTGEPFNKNVVPFSAWVRGRPIVKATNARMVAMALAPRLLDAGLLVPARSGRACIVCERHAVIGWRKYCPRCGPLLTGIDGEKVVTLVAALKRAYCYELDTFLCYHLGVPLDLFDMFSPFYLVYDHLVPRMTGNVVVSSALANQMKSATDEEEWHAYFRMLDAAMRGGKFEQEKLEFKYWGWESEFKGRKVA